MFILKVILAAAILVVKLSSSEYYSAYIFFVLLIWLEIVECNLLSHLFQILLKYHLYKMRNAWTEYSSDQ